MAKQPIVKTYNTFQEAKDNKRTSRHIVKCYYHGPIAKQKLQKLDNNTTRSNYRGKVRNKTFNNTTEQDLGLITETSVVLQYNVIVKQTLVLGTHFQKVFIV